MKKNLSIRELGFIVTTFPFRKVLTENPEFFHKEDVRLVDEVKKYFDGYGIDSGLNPLITGSILKGSRDYNDIDIVVYPKREESQIDYHSLWDYSNAARTLESCARGKTKINEWEVDILGMMPKSYDYGGVNVEYRFRIKSPHSRTSVDVTFGEPISK